MDISQDCSNNNGNAYTKHIIELANTLALRRGKGNDVALVQNIMDTILSSKVSTNNNPTTLHKSSDTIPLEQLYKMSNKSLRDILVKHKLKKSGNKKELANRIWNFNSHEPLTIKDVPFNVVEDSDDDCGSSDNMSIYSLINNRLVLFMNNKFEICSEHYVPAPTEVVLVPIKNWVFIETQEDFEYIGLAIATSTGNYIDRNIIPLELKRFSQ